MTPRRQDTPPDDDPNDAGLWFHELSDGRVASHLFRLEGGLLMDAYDMCAGEYHDPGDIWSGPFPVPSLPGASPDDARP